MEKSFAVWTGATNLFILAIPVLYINLMLSLIQLLVVFLILIFPVVLLASFFHGVKCYYSSSFKV